MKNEKLTNAKNDELLDTNSKGDKEAKNAPKNGEPKGEPTSEPKGEPTSETKAEPKNPKKGELTNRKYSTLLDAAKANDVDLDTLKTEAIKRLKDVISSAYEDIKRLHESKTPVSDFIKMSRAEQSNKVLQISSGSLEQRLGYDRETYTSVTKATTPDEAVIYTLLACIGWEATSKLCGIKEASTTKKSNGETKSTVVLDF